MAGTQVKEKEPENQERIISKELIIGCPNCHVQCHSIEMVKKGDGNFWTDDICWNCKTKLPAVSIKRT